MQDRTRVYCGSGHKHSLRHLLQPLVGFLFFEMNSQYPMTLRLGPFLVLNISSSLFLNTKHASSAVVMHNTEWKYS